jgi:hypothetical protein
MRFARCSSRAFASDLNHARYCGGDLRRSVGRQDVGKQNDTTIGPHHFRRRISTWHILKPIIAALVSVLNSRIAVRFGLSEQIIGFSTQSEKE